jgi:hypothetical protein
MPTRLSRKCMKLPVNDKNVQIIRKLNRLLIVRLYTIIAIGSTSILNARQTIGGLTDGLHARRAPCIVRA